MTEEHVKKYGTTLKTSVLSIAIEVFAIDATRAVEELEVAVNGALKLKEPLAQLKPTIKTI